VTRETIQEYIPAHNLLTKYGGQDTWEYVYEVERESMLKLLREAEERQGAQPESTGEDKIDLPHDEARPVNDDAISEGAYDSQEDSGVEGNVKQVRFSPSSPPSRQSRYGGDEEDVYSSIVGSDQSLLKGSATSHSFRRRQVTRLMSLQESPEKEELKERNRSALGIDRQFEAVEPGVSVGNIILR
jgi:hypothetical protein